MIDGGDFGGFNPRMRVGCSLYGQPLSNARWCHPHFLCL
jgi:hypothetical protein